MNNHPEYPHLSMDAGRIQALLDGWNAADVAAYETADEFADAFYVAELVDDPAADGRDDDLDAEEILQRARQHWQACRAEEEQAEASRLEAIDEQVAKYPGAAREVWGGWVWVVNGNEHSWSKRATQVECHEVVFNVVERIGVDDAFDLPVDRSGGMHADLSLWLVTNGEATEADEDTEWDGVESVLVAATTPEAAAKLATAYDRDELEVGNLAWNGMTVACVYLRDRETGLYA